MPEISGAAMFASGEISSSATASIPPPMAVVISVWKSWDFQAGGVAILICRELYTISPPMSTFFFTSRVRPGESAPALPVGNRAGRGVRVVEYRSATAPVKECRSNAGRGLHPRPERSTPAKAEQQMTESSLKD